MGDLQFSLIFPLWPLNIDGFQDFRKHRGQQTSFPLRSLTSSGVNSSLSYAEPQIRIQLSIRNPSNCRISNHGEYIYIYISIYLSIYQSIYLSIIIYHNLS